jgi:hypothetical protein
MLDPQRFTRGTRVRESQLAPVMVRRLKSDLRALGSAQQYPERHVLGVRLSHDSGRWSAEWLRPDGKTVDRSSIEAFHRTLSVHAAAFGAGALVPSAREESGHTLPEEYGDTDETLELAFEEDIRYKRSRTEAP